MTFVFPSYLSFLTKLMYNRFTHPNGPLLGNIFDELASLNVLLRCWCGFTIGNHLGNLAYKYKKGQWMKRQTQNLNSPS